jgi:hypothetical protein
MTIKFWLSVFTLVSCVRAQGRCEIAFGGRIEAGTCNATCAAGLLRSTNRDCRAGTQCCTESAPCSNNGVCMDERVCTSDPARVAISSLMGAMGCLAFPTAIKCCQLRATVSTAPTTPTTTTTTTSASTTTTSGPFDTPATVVVPQDTRPGDPITRPRPIDVETQSVSGASATSLGTAAPASNSGNLGIIVGGAVGGVACLLITALIVCLVLRSKRGSDESERGDSASASAIQMEPQQQAPKPSIYAAKHIPLPAENLPGYVGGARRAEQEDAEDAEDGRYTRPPATQQLASSASYDDLPKKPPLDNEEDDYASLRLAPYTSASQREAAGTEDFAKFMTFVPEH